MDLIWWVLNNWLLVAYSAAVLIAWGIGGWRLALGVATLGGGVLLYRQGHKDAERTHEERASRIEQERENAYRKIDGRGTTGGDVVDRLRKHNY